jgi:hypothetical protein
LFFRVESVLARAAAGVLFAIGQRGLEGVAIWARVVLDLDASGADRFAASGFRKAALRMCRIGCKTDGY